MFLNLDIFTDLNFYFSEWEACRFYASSVCDMNSAYMQLRYAVSGAI